MSNTLTNLIPDIYAALDVVSRELVGFIPAVTRDPSVDRVATGQTVRVPQTLANSAGKDTTPAMSLPSAADQTIGNKSLTISKSRAYPFSWSGEEQYAVKQGPGYLSIRQQQIAQAVRALINEMETDIGAAAYKAASRAYGTAGTTPFASDLTAMANLKKILDDNGAPQSDRHLVIDTAAGVKLRSLTQLTNVNQAGGDATLRQGRLLDLSNFAIGESAQVAAHTKGTGTLYVSDGGSSVGDTAIPVKTGSDTIVAGDVVKFENDAANQYVVTSALSGGSFTIAEPGLKVAVSDGDTVTIQNDFTGNVAFSRNAILFATRLPTAPQEGDLAIDRMIVTDPVTGISFEFVVYPGYRMNEYEVAAAWGVTNIKPEHSTILLG